MSLLKKTVRDEVLGLTRHPAKKGHHVDVDLTSDFGQVRLEIAGEDLDEHVLVTRRAGRAYKVRTGKAKRVWRWQS